MSREVTGGRSQVVTDPDELLKIFELGQRSPRAFRLGLETEKIGVDAKTLEAVPFGGERGIEQILKHLAQRYAWEGVWDQDRLVALKKGQAAITLEPGGQLELSGRPCDDLRCLEEELFDHLRELRAVSDPLGVHWYGLGIQPKTRLSEMPWVPRSRYRVMKAYYAPRSTAAMEMMSLTAAIQVNLDYKDEQDAGLKVKVGTLLGPIVGAMMANSAIDGGDLNGLCSRRLDIWTKTDPDRCGMPRFFIDGSFSFEKYREYALDVPMYFLFRDGQYLTGQQGQSFRQVLSRADTQLTLRDWETHLTTLFPDVRVKDHLEVRTTDANWATLALALTAFWKGVFYEPHTLENIAEQLKDISYETLLAGMTEASIWGLCGRMGRHSLLFWGREMMAHAVVGLSRQDRQNGLNEIRFLTPLRELLDVGLSPGEMKRKKWRGRIQDILL